MHVLGVDLSSRAIDLVLLDENAQRAQWQRVELDGATAFDRARDIANKMPQPGWYEHHGVYLIAVEEPMGFQSRILYRIQGAILACLPDVPVWEVRPAAWKNALGLKQTEKPGWDAFPAMHAETTMPVHPPSHWIQDALDALGVALYARDLNHKAITSLLQERRPA